MCMILDGNSCGDFVKYDDDMKPIHKWINQHDGQLIFSNQEKIQEEFCSNSKMRQYLTERVRRSSKKVKFINKDKVEQAMKKIKNRYTLKSDDLHILGLAWASGSKLLCSRDQDLHNDFKKIIGGSIYQNKKHKGLLKRNTCNP